MFRSIKSQMLQSQSEWNRRNNYMSATLAELVKHYVKPETNRGLDIGCAEGAVADFLRKETGLEMWGVDPRQQSKQISAGGAELLPGLAHQLPFADSYFDCAILANVYEHIPPTLRDASLEEIRRVLVKGGKLIGQLPNPRFPIEQHSRLPLMGFLPRVVQLKYWQIAPVSWKPSARSWFPVTISDLTRKVECSGFETVIIKNFGYPPEALPSSFQRIARLLSTVIRAFPFAWQFVFQKD